VEVTSQSQHLEPPIVLSNARQEFEVRDNCYGLKPIRRSAKQLETLSVRVSTKASKGWYDFTVTTPGISYRYAGRIETGKWSISDPAMG
jgi:phospholipase C